MQDYDVDEALEGDDDLFGEDEDDEFEGDELYGARKRRARRAKRRLVSRPVASGPGGPGTLYLKFAATACGIGATVTLTAQANRDCRPLDLRVVATTAAGVVDPGLQVGDLSVHGKDLSLSGGLVGGQMYSPLNPQYPNCAIPEIIRAGETVTLTVTGISAGATVVSGVLQCRAVA